MLKKLVIVLLVLAVVIGGTGCNLAKNKYAVTPTSAPAQMTPAQRIALLENEVVLLQRAVDKLQKQVAALSSE